jgi:hypothetical protein
MNNQYDVSEFRKVHKGGDIFECGTDMTTMYQQQHGSNIQMIQRYKV